MENQLKKELFYDTKYGEIIQLLITHRSFFIIMRDLAIDFTCDDYFSTIINTSL